MRRVISALLLALLASGTAHASVADVNAAARAAGDRKDLAITVGRSLFTQQWPAQVYHVHASSVGAHVVIGLSVWGVKFHQPLTREQFADEIVALVAKTFAALPAAEEVDVWSEVPIDVGKGAIVNGDLAVPTTRTVFTATVLRRDGTAALKERLLHASSTYWDEAWAATTFKRGQ